MMTPQTIRTMLGVAMIALATLFTGCAAVRGLEKQTSFLVVGEAQETQLGAEYEAELAKSMEMIDDPVAQAWLNRVGAALAEHSPKTEQQFRFFFVNDPAVNAFAIPGGACYVNRGLIEFVDNEAQAVAVVGHEINHVTQRHGITRMQRQMAIDLAGQAAAGATQQPGAQQIASLGVSGAGFLASRRFSQGDESEADALGVKAMHAAGWDPREAAALWAKMGAASASQTPFWLESFVSTHPTSSQRQQDILNLCKTLPLSDSLRKNSDEFKAMQERFRAMPAPKTTVQ